MADGGKYKMSESSTVPKQAYKCRREYSNEFQKSRTLLTPPVDRDDECKAVRENKERVKSGEIQYEG